MAIQSLEWSQGGMGVIQAATWTYLQFKVLSCTHNPFPAGHSSGHGTFSKEFCWTPADVVKQTTVNN